MMNLFWLLFLCNDVPINMIFCCTMLWLYININLCNITHTMFFFYFEKLSLLIDQKFLVISPKLLSALLEMTISDKTCLAAAIQQKVIER